MIYLSFGAGVQSTAMLLMSDRGVKGCPRADVAIFADTGDEPWWVYEMVERAKTSVSIPVEVVSKGHLFDDVKKRGKFVPLPVFTPNDEGRESAGRRQCTREYKLAPIQARVRELMGVKPGKRLPADSVTCMIGLSIDEASRLSPSRVRWIKNIWPLVDAGMSRSSCERLLRSEGLLPIEGAAIVKSSCVGCPYHSDKYWRNLRDHHPGHWEKAVQHDREIRNLSMQGEKRPAYLHRSLKPLDEVEFLDDKIGDLFDEECEGHCGV